MKFFQDKLDPGEITGAKDALKDLGKEIILRDVLKRRIKTVAAAARIIVTVPIQGFLEGFQSSEVAADFDELNNMNENIQKLLYPTFSADLPGDWRTRLRDSIEKDAAAALHPETAFGPN